jgi:hypothetical protein
MEFSMEISMEFHGIPWNFMENSMNWRNDFRQGKYKPTRHPGEFFFILTDSFYVLGQFFFFTWLCEWLFW